MNVQDAVVSKLALLEAKPSRTSYFMIVGAVGLEPLLPSDLKTYISVSVNGQSRATRQKGGTSPVWNESFAFSAQDHDEVTIRLHRVESSGYICVGSVSRRLADFKPEDQDQTLTMPSLRNHVHVIYRISETRPLFALIIGIDDYLKKPKLRGCVNDAEAMRSFLVFRLHVPDSHVKLLINKGATQVNILNEWKSHLVNNDSIQMGDSIVIFFAGHGSRVEAPAGWTTTDGMIETICPQDEECLSQTGELVHGLHDKEINHLLHCLAKGKGNNITVIFDTCHSGGTARDGLVPRFTLTTNPIPFPIGTGDWDPTPRTANISIPTEFRYPFMESHVLLAACRQEQFASEAYAASGVVRGLFTRTILEQLDNVALDRITPVGLIDSLERLPNQDPQCEGAKKFRRLFDSRGSVDQEATFALVTNEKGKFEVCMGSMCGVIEGTIFQLQMPYSGELRASSVNVNSSILESINTDGKPGKDARVKASRWNNRNLIFTWQPAQGFSEGVLDAFSTCTRRSWHSGSRWHHVKAEYGQKADIEIRGLGNSFVIKRLDAIIPKYANPEVEFSLTDTYRFPDIFDAIAHFNYFLQSRNDKYQLKSLIDLELYRLDSERYPRVEDYKIDLGSPNGTHIQGATTLVEVEGAKYGFKVLNSSPYDLFAYLFYFDPLTYSIEQYYGPFTNNMTPALRRKQGFKPTYVTVGYGAGGGFAVQFSVPDGAKVDTSFFKLFVFDTYVDLTWIEQESPFKPHARAAKRRKPPAGIWATWTVALTVRRSEPRSA